MRGKPAHFIKNYSWDIKVLEAKEVPKTDMQNNNMSVTYCFLFTDFLLGISAEKRD